MISFEWAWTLAHRVLSFRARVSFEKWSNSQSWPSNSVLPVLWRRATVYDHQVTSGFNLLNIGSMSIVHLFNLETFTSANCLWFSGLRLSTHSESILTLTQQCFRKPQYIYRSLIGDQLVRAIWPSGYHHISSSWARVTQDLFSIFLALNLFWRLFWELASFVLSKQSIEIGTSMQRVHQTFTTFFDHKKC